MNKSIQIDLTVNSFFDAFEKMVRSDVKDIKEILYGDDPKKNNIDLYFFNKLLITDKNIDKETNPTLYKDTYGKRGVYVFKIKNKIKIPFKLYYGGAAQLKQQFLSIKEFDEGDILYLGKSLTIGPRLREHFESEVKGTTSSLILNHTNRNFLIGNFDIYIFILKEEFYHTDGKPFLFENTIISAIESLMHEELIAKMGSKRS